MRARHKQCPLPCCTHDPPQLQLRLGRLWWLRVAGNVEYSCSGAVTLCLCAHGGGGCGKDEGGRWAVQAAGVATPLLPMHALLASL